MHVAIIGAGIAGISTANALSKRAPSDVKITLIDPKSYVEVPWATIRALFDANIAKGCTFPLGEWAAARQITHKRASAEALSTHSVILDSGEQLNFDVCIIATGATTHVQSLGRRSPNLDIAERRKRMQVDGETLLAKRHVLIAGGGAIGSEFAGDIADYARQQGKKVQVTLVHSGEHLVPEFKPYAAAKLKQKLEALGVRVVLKDRAVQQDGKWILQSSGEVLDVDGMIMSVGIQPSTRFLKDGGLTRCVDEKGYVKVDEYFRVVEGGGRLFAVGDCSNTLAKTGAVVLLNRDTVANNVLVALSALKDRRNIEQYTRGMKRKAPGPTITLVTVGSNDGIAQTPIGAMSFLLPAVKNKTMFLFRARFGLGF